MTPLFNLNKAVGKTVGRVTTRLGKHGEGLCGTLHFTDGSLLAFDASNPKQIGMVSAFMDSGLTDKAEPQPDCGPANPEPHGKPIAEPAVGSSAWLGRDAEPPEGYEYTYEWNEARRQLWRHTVKAGGAKGGL
jgi:hypothetical protein